MFIILYLCYMWDNRIGKFKSLSVSFSFLSADKFKSIECRIPNNSIDGE